MSSTLSSSDIEAIRILLQMVTNNNLDELKLTVREGVSVTIKTTPLTNPLAVAYTQPQLSAPVQAQSPQTANRSQTTIAAPTSQAKRGIPSASPATGIYYQSPSPGDPPFVKVGDTIKTGQVIGLLEAMKVFSDIHSEVSGKVLELVAVDGQLVKDGEPLLFVG